MISRAALKAKMSKRLEYLAKPRKYPLCENENSIKTRPLASEERKNKIISARLIELSKPNVLYNYSPYM